MTIQEIIEKIIADGYEIKPEILHAMRKHEVFDALMVLRVHEHCAFRAALSQADHISWALEAENVEDRTIGTTTSEGALRTLVQVFEIPGISLQKEITQ